MTAALLSLALLFFLLGLLELVLCAIWSNWYFRAGPILVREEWKSFVSAKEAAAALLTALSDTEMFFQQEGNEIFARPENVLLGVTPRIRSVLSDEKDGAMLLQKTRPNLGALSFALAFLVLVTWTGYTGFAVFLAILLCPFLIVITRTAFHRVRRLRGLKKVLAELGNNACPRCGYDLQGIPGDRPCPECGRHFSGQHRFANPEQIRCCLQEAVTTQRMQGILFSIAGLAALTFSAVCATGVIWFVSFQLGGKNLDFAPLIFLSVVLLGIWGALSERSRRRFSPEDGPVRMPDRDLPYSYGRIASIAGLGRLGGQVIFMGPRLIIEGVEMLSGYSKRTASIDRAVRMIGLLMKKTTSLGLVDLKEPEETTADTRRIAEWLRRRGWLGITERGDRVFLYTESRERLDPQDS